MTTAHERSSRQSVGIVADMRILHVITIVCLLLTGCSRTEENKVDLAQSKTINNDDLYKLYTEDHPARERGRVAITEANTKAKSKVVPEEVMENSRTPIGNLDPSLAEATIPIPRGRSKSRTRSQTPTFPIPSSSDDSSEFSCSTPKTCPMMRSCKEAYYHLNKCGDTDRDRDGDGVPCENIC